MHHDNSFQFASDFINYTNASIFLTGKAGTGKTTFLKHCKENGIKNTVVVAPTGVAAMNAGGTTIHSFFQLPFTPFLPAISRFDNTIGGNDKNSLIAQLRLNNDRKVVMQQLELLIIDEISMVRCDVLDAIHTVLQHVRSQYSKPFGGVQVLLIGDMHQLPPVIKDEEWQLLSPHYKSPYFFNSHVIEELPPVYIELDKIYRQNDPAFVQVLNQVRNNEMDEAGFDLLHSRYLPSFNPAKEENYITLTTHNNKADAINFNALNEIDGPLRNFEALIVGEFYEKSYPADSLLKLKVGAQVMFIKNDTEKVRRYFNGKIGVIEKMDNEKIHVLCAGDDNPIEVKKEKWKNIRYAVDKNSQQIEENEIGSFTQFPLRLAWAITIHKSQGLSFEKAIIDAGEAFAPGQVYVALSRCTSLQGMILHSRINQNSLHSDRRITAFAKTQKTSLAQIQLLQNAQHQFQQDTIKKIFNFSNPPQQTKAIITFLISQQNSFNAEALPFAEQLHNLCSTIAETALKFESQLHQLLASELLPENNNALQVRLAAAANHFSTEIQKFKIDINRFPWETDSKGIATDANKLLATLYNNISLQLHLLNGCRKGFTLAQYLQHKRTFTLPLLQANAYAGKSAQLKTDSPHPQLYQLLRNKRDALCEEKNCPVYLIAGTATLEEMARYLPQTMDELNQINGFGIVKTKQFGGAFLPIIQAYCDLHNLSTNIEAKPIKAKKIKKEAEIKTDTKTASFDLYKQGKSIEEIARERNITINTVENHLSFFVSIDELDIHSLIAQEKIFLIKAGIEKLGNTSSKTLKENLPDHISYGEIKMVMASVKTPIT